MKYQYKTIVNGIALVIAAMLISSIAFAQTRRAPEIKSCLSSEFALSALESADPNKNWDQNYEAGKRIGYIIAEYYQKAIWAMDEPETEGREAILFALRSSQERMKYMTADALRRDVLRCRKSFKKE